MYVILWNIAQYAYIMLYMVSWMHAESGYEGDKMML